MKMFAAHLNRRSSRDFYNYFPTEDKTDFYLSLLFYHTQDSPTVKVKFLHRKDFNNCYVIVNIYNGNDLRSKSAATIHTANSKGHLTVNMRKGDYSLMQFHMHEYACDHFFDTVHYDTYNYVFRRLDLVEIYHSDSCRLQEYHVTQDKVGLPSNYFAEDSSSEDYPGDPGYVQVGAVTTVTGKVYDAAKTVSVILKSGSFQATKSLGNPPSTLFNITVRIMGASAELEASFIDKPIVIETSHTMNGGSMRFLNIKILNLVHMPYSPLASGTLQTCYGLLTPLLLLTRSDKSSPMPLISFSPGLWLRH
ncbi:uncharacterized protein LOC135366430 isoform X2 [Ornithodoros turicata]|uniref:uncharacterized protein LOC135366430 isoform X2 n=1 Tax=Ornithodoros turicata TaxID=34597 RepID=UPI0031398B53